MFHTYCTPLQTIFLFLAFINMTFMKFWSKNSSLVIYLMSFKVFRQAKLASAGFWGWEGQAEQLWSFLELPGRHVPLHWLRALWCHHYSGEGEGAVYGIAISSLLPENSRFGNCCIWHSSLLALASLPQPLAIWEWSFLQQLLTAFFSFISASCGLV